MTARVVSTVLVLTGCILVGVGYALTILHHRDQFTTTESQINIPNPDLVLQISNNKCYAWNINRSDEFLGLSPKVWICEDGYVMSDPSGSVLPFQFDNDDGEQSQ